MAVDRFLGALYIGRMKPVKTRARTTKHASAAEQEMTRLEYWVDELLRTCERLGKENRLLRAQESVLLADRERLTERNERARDRVEAMIMRLKALDKN